MLCTWNYAKKFVVIGVLFVLCGYLLFLLFSGGPHAGSLEYPSYRLVNQWYTSGKFGAFVAPDTGVIVHVPVLNTSTYEFVPSLFKVDTAYVQQLLSHSARQAILLSIQLHAAVLLENTCDKYFSCRCGRVSDPCVCCGHLSPPDLDSSSTGAFSTRPVVLQPAVPGKLDAVSSVPGLCLNITYRPKTGTIHLAAALFSSLPSSFSSPLLKQGVAGVGVGAGAGAVDDRPPSQPSRFILFDRVLSSPLASPPTTCAENSLAGADVALCVNLTRMSYIYDPGTEHKTAFVGCGRVQIILRRSYLIGDYGQFCFRAHRGAVDDVDQKAAGVVNSNQVVGPAPINVAAAKADVAVEPKADVHLSNSDFVGQIKPPPRLPPVGDPDGNPTPAKGETGNPEAGVKEKPKPIAGSFDQNDGIRGIP